MKRKISSPHPNKQTIHNKNLTTTNHAITADYRANLLRKAERFAESTTTNKAIHIVMITANGLARNQYADIVNNEVTIDDLFRE